MHKRPIIYSFGAFLLTAVGIAGAQNAYTTRPKHVLAGPNQDYPLVAELDAGAPLDVHGCLSDWSWCDVSFGDDEDDRGWIFSDGVSFVYEGDRVPLYSYAPSLGITVITFSVGSYWGDYYRGRPWYSQRDQWEHRRMPEHNVPSGHPHEGPPPMRNGHAPPGRRERPEPNEQPMPHASSSPMRERPPVGGHQESRGEERGGSVPPREREAQQPQRTRGPESGHAASSHGKPDHGEHEKEHPPQDPH